MTDYIDSKRLTLGAIRNKYADFDLRKIPKNFFPNSCIRDRSSDSETNDVTNITVKILGESHQTNVRVKSTNVISLKCRKFTELFNSVGANEGGVVRITKKDATDFVITYMRMP
jgi:hypothetical protein